MNRTGNATNDLETPCWVCGSTRVTCIRDDEHPWDDCTLRCDECGNYPWPSKRMGRLRLQAEWKRTAA